ncbi:MAG TPA: N-acetylmuramoyl-L-alanine amidase [Thermoclostridium sp.]|nr:N-acetylmuramoyl-L-alanine amidase [Thermoclostridium sp.]
MKIVIDSGHGLYTSGKRCKKSIDPNETREWILNDRIADRLEVLLADYDCKVIRVDDTTGTKDISLANRVKTANNAKADIYISIHHNAGINGGTGGGTVVFYCSSKTERRTQAERLYKAITNQTDLIGNRSARTVYKGFYVVKNTKMPAFLIENGFMDSRTDTPVILTKEHAERTALGLASYLVEELSLAKRKTVGKAPQTATEVYYPRYTGKTTTLSAALTSLGITSTYSFRKKIAAANGITRYIGTAAQNTQMYNLLKAGILKRI